MLHKSPAQGLPAWPLWLASIFSQFPPVTAHCSKSEDAFHVLAIPWEVMWVLSLQGCDDQSGERMNVRCKVEVTVAKGVE